MNNNQISVTTFGEYGDTYRQVQTQPSYCYPSNWTQYTYWPTYVYPTYCASDYHVFECSHAEHCKCGQTHRHVDPPKCSACGK